MEENINIAEILKDKPQGTKLYSSACGKCKLEKVYDKSFKISFYNSKFGFMNGGEGYLDKNGKLYDDGECVVFPSKEMRDWSKFAWKRGDVLVTEDGSTKVIFECFEDDTYLTFNGKYCLQKTNIDETFIVDTNGNLTECFSLQDKDIAQIYIHNIEDRIGGILNMETLEIEKTQPEFKDGDILLYKSPEFTYFSSIFILGTNRNEMRSYVRFSIGKGSIDYDVPVYNLNTDRFRYATEEEKQQLFSALSKEGKAWDSEKKEVVDLKPKVELKPFDKVLVRDSESDKWRANLFGYIDKDEYYHCVYVNWAYCIPYTGNESLLGTTKDVEE